jgi:hypothetical protein
MTRCLVPSNFVQLAPGQREGKEEGKDSLHLRRQIEKKRFKFRS